MNYRTCWCLALLAGCAPDAGEAPPQELPARLKAAAGCGDLTLVVSTEDASWSLLVQAPGLLETAREVNDVVNFFYEAPSPIDIVLVEQSPVTPDRCGPLAQAVDGAPRWMEATDGRVDLVVSPLRRSAAHVDITIRDLVVEDPEAPEAGPIAVPDAILEAEVPEIQE